MYTLTLEPKNQRKGHGKLEKAAPGADAGRLLPAKTGNGNAGGDGDSEGVHGKAQGNKKDLEQRNHSQEKNEARAELAPRRGRL